ncbi:hypothetical protein A3D78_05590 [Candidatus Gottesmanbacteria bacterium RIFCSPHIGHO2_02_FULL_39_14]|uniref:Glycosyltransferase 2-like domain-containing protein n=2 Tax=Candidatus Gottesmaniibacteriota TaxID=1752720 RepID=A0A1F5ZXU9_9BACT|nr:MAG: hypothetical protein A3D78_05590 [Candidatus Gottesmanbacteria bacterium RIFCSPHIGHO2_02_FULL_39_14]OGG31425.1 MAG: hypothetical protein A3I51_00165 [Candidatus Gottesmanbacteria bacterium RIFCSPLOWO2_02_FULL_38_8]
MAKKFSLEIVIPVYNEEKELEESINKLHSFLTKQFRDYRWSITIADNASTDNSFTIAKLLARRKQRVDFIHLDQKGRGRAVKKAWRDSQADYLSYMDVDLSTDLKYFKPLIYSLSQGYDIAIGNRLMSQSIVKNRPFKREVLSRIYNIMIRLFFQVSISDAQCGFKAVTRDVASKLIPHIQDNAWFFDSELLIVGEKVGFNIYQQPVHWTDNPGSTVRVLKTVYGDLQGLWRLFWQRPWTKISI